MVVDNMERKVVGAVRDICVLDRKSIIVLEGTQTSPSRPSDKDARSSGLRFLILQINCVLHDLE
jgi:hypothetical protein